MRTNLPQIYEKQNIYADPAEVPVVLDIEPVPGAEVMAQIALLAREVVPGPISIYAVPDRPKNQMSYTDEEWHERLEQARTIAPHVDFINCSLYTPYLKSEITETAEQRVNAAMVAAHAATCCTAANEHEIPVYASVSHRVAGHKAKLPVDEFLEDCAIFLEVCKSMQTPYGFLFWAQQSDALQAEKYVEALADFIDPPAPPLVIAEPMQ